MRTKFRYGPKILKIKKDARLEKNSIVVNHEIKQAYFIEERHLSSIQIKPSKKELTLKWLFLQKGFTKFLRKDIKLSQLRELKALLYYFNRGVIFSWGNLALLINHDIKIDFFRRLKLGGNLKASDSKLFFMIMLGKELGYEVWKNKKSDPIKGRNNPAWNHCGKLSPWSEKSIVHDTSRAKENQRSALTKRDNTAGNHRSVRYWIERKNMSLKEAKVKIHELNNRGLEDHYIPKYGKMEGKKRWSKRQDGWQETMNSKDDEEKERINRLRGLDKNGDPHTYYNNTLCEKRPDLSNIPAQLYYIELKKEDNIFYKIGITKHNVGKRIGKRFCGYDVSVKFTHNSTLKEVIDLEQNILERYKEFRIFNPDSINSTEIFTKDVFEGKYEII